MAETTRKVLLREVPPRLKGKIARRVADTDRQMNDVLAQILADHYSIPYTPAARKAGDRAVGASATIMVYLPADVAEAIELDTVAQKSGGDRNASLRNTAVRIISDALGVPFKPTGRWVGQRRRRRAAA